MGQIETLALILIKTGLLGSDRSEASKLPEYQLTSLGVVIATIGICLMEVPVHCAATQAAEIERIGSFSPSFN